MIITLQEAVETMTINCGNGDICKKGNTDAGFIIDNNCHVMNAKTTTEFYRFESADWYGEKWQIIPAKKEMVSADVLIAEHFREINQTKAISQPHFALAKASAKNRDLLYADLMEEAKNAVKTLFLYDTRSGSLLRDEINKVLAATSHD